MFKKGGVLLITQPVKAFLAEKNEMFYGRSWIGVSPDNFAKELDDYINWYNRKRIKLSLGRLSPMEYRQHVGFTE